MIVAEEAVLEGTFLTHFVEELGQCVFFEHSSAAEVYGVECMIGCMLEAKISVNAAVHLACAKQIITKIDLDGPVLCSEDPILGGAVFNERKITSPTTQVWASMAFKGFAIWQTDTISVLSAFYKVRPIDSTSIVK